METKFKVSPEVAYAQQEGVEGLEAELASASKEWVERRDAVRRTGGQLVWLTSQSESGKLARELAFRGPSAERNLQFAESDLRMDQLLEQYSALSGREDTAEAA